MDSRMSSAAHPDISGSSAPARSGSSVCSDALAVWRASFWDESYLVIECLPRIPMAHTARQKCGMFSACEMAISTTSSST
eukprot:4653834-Lingulodinium_polyedra.AAC.1